MNEIQINLGGRERTLRFDIGTLKLISNGANDVDVNAAAVSVGLDLLLKVCHNGLLRYCKVQKQEPDFSAEQVEEWVDALSHDEAMKILRSYSEAYAVKSDGEVSTGEARGKKK